MLKTELRVRFILIAILYVIFFGGYTAEVSCDQLQDFDNILEKSDFVTDWEWEDEDKKINATVKDDQFEYKIYYVTYEGWQSFKRRFTCNVGSDDKIRIQVKTSGLSDGLILDFGLSGCTSTGACHFSPSEIDFSSNSSQWVTVTSEKSNIANDNTVDIKIYTRVRKRHFEGHLSSPVTVYLKNLSATFAATPTTIIYKGFCEPCNSSYECMDGYYCMGYAYADDPFEWVLGRCVPDGTVEDPCGIVNDNGSGGCFIATAAFGSHLAEEVFVFE